MNKAKRILILVALGAAAVFITAYIALRVAFPADRVLSVVQVQGSEALGRTVEVGGIRVGVFPRLRVSVREVRVANAPGFSTEPMAALDRLDLSVSWMSLLRFSPAIHEIRLRGPDFLYEVDAAGNTNLDGLGGASDASAVAESDTTLPELPVALSLRALVIENGRVRYRDTGSDLEITLGDIRQRSSLDLDPRLRNVRAAGRLDLREISLRDGTTGLRKGGVRVSVVHDLHIDLPGDSLRIAALGIELQDVRVHVEGVLRDMTQDVPVADIRVSAPEVSLASLLREVPRELSPEIAKLRAAGTASLDARVSGPLGDDVLSAVRADIAVRDASFRHADVPQGIEEFTLDLAVRGDSVRLDGTGFRTGTNRFGMEALLTGVLDSIPHLRGFKAEGTLDLENLSAVARAIGMLDEGIRLSGMQTIMLEASGALDPAHPQNLAVRGDITLRDVEAVLPDLPPLRASGSVEIRNERIRQRLDARIGNSDASVRVDVHHWLALLMPEQAQGRRALAQVEIRSALVDLDELLPETGGEPEPDAEPLTRYPDWPQLDAQVTVLLERTRLMNLEMTAFTLNAALSETEAAADLKGTLYSGSFTSALRVVPRDSVDMGVAFRLDVSRVEANDFISRLNDRLPLKNPMLRALAATDSAIFGRLDLKADFATHGLPDAFVDNLSGALAFKVGNGRLVGVEWTRSLSSALAEKHSALGFEQLEFGELRGDFRVEDGQLLVRDFGFSGSPAGAMKAEGTVGFDNVLDLRVAQTLPPAASRLVLDAGGALMDQLSRLTGAPGLAGASLVPVDRDGNAILYFLVDGEVSSPRFALDASRMAREGAAGAARGAVDAAAQRARAEAEARARQERDRLEAEARERLDAERKRLEEAAAAERRRLEEAAEAERKRLEEQAAEEAKRQTERLLRGIGR